MMRLVKLEFQKEHKEMYVSPAWKTSAQYYEAESQAKNRKKVELSGRLQDPTGYLAFRMHYANV